MNEWTKMKRMPLSVLGYIQSGGGLGHVDILLPANFVIACSIWSVSSIQQYDNLFTFQPAKLNEVNKKAMRLLAQWYTSKPVDALIRHHPPHTE